MPRVTIHAQADVIMPKPGIGNAIRRRLGRDVPTYTAPLVAEAVVDVHPIERLPQVFIRRDKAGLFLLVQMDFTPGKHRIVSTSLREVGDDRTKGHRVMVGPLPGGPSALEADSVRVSEAVTLNSVLETERRNAAREVTVDEVAAIFEVPRGVLEIEGGQTLAAMEPPVLHMLGSLIPEDQRGAMLRAREANARWIGIDLAAPPSRTVTTHGQPKDHAELMALLNSGGSVMTDMEGRMCMAHDANGVFIEFPKNRKNVAPLFPVGTDVPLNAGETGTPTSATSVLHDMAFIAERLEVAQFQIAFTPGGADAASVENDAHVALKALQLLREKVTAMHAQAQQAVRSIEAARTLFADAEARHFAGAGLGLTNVQQMRVHLDNARHHARRAKAEHNPALDLRESGE
ncbi:hypothetical protein TMCBR2_gp039c [Caulobacter phage TMCBR2]|uniref:Uncharacterized protein n=1 Tax=Caulobacter phage TMCBR2 TaxID=3025404 RepID=A0AAF0BYF8_9CAUD|nr:hypothetical protein TMCBR2_gp039c [Caulobacter phage TMCBR2]